MPAKMPTPQQVDKIVQRNKEKLEAIKRAKDAMKTLPGRLANAEKAAKTAQPLLRKDPD